MLTSELTKNAGFYSQLFFLINHYLTAKKNNMKFKIKSDGWLFKYEKGWDDYFENVDILEGSYSENICKCHYMCMDTFTITEYKAIIKDIYKYNEKTKKKIEEIIKQLNIKDYDSIFIRHGDKLGGESNYVPLEKYITVLLNKNPNCHTIFLQTDDYNVYIELQKYIIEKQLQITVISLCKEHTKGGMIIFNMNIAGVEQALHEHDINKPYITTVIDNLRKSVAIDRMNNDEIYQHTMDMIIGIDIVLNSNICICEYSSNVSRFIKLAHNDSNNVYDVNYPNDNIDWNNTTCPSFELLLLKTSH
jgi:hypothetical protein